MSSRMRELQFNSNKKISLYFLDIKITVKYHSYEFVELLEQGWSSRCTKEYRSSLSIKSNKNRSLHSRKLAGEKSSLKLRGRKKPERSIDQKKRFRTKDISFFTNYYYNTLTQEFIWLDKYDISDSHIKVFQKTGGRVIWDMNNVKRYCSNKVPTPEGYYDGKPTKKFLIYDITSNLIKLVMLKDLHSDYVKIHRPNGDRVKVVFLDNSKTLNNNSYFYLSKSFINQYNLPKNCKLVKQY